MNFCSIFVNIIKTLLIPVICVCIALVLYVIEEDGGEDKELVVAILSARGNEAKRESLRKTWVGNIKSNPKLNNRVAVKFVIGNKGCHVHDDDKVDPYSCEELNFYHRNNPKDEMLAFKNTNSEQIIPIESDSVGFDFKVHHDIVIGVLGVLDSCIQSNQKAVNVSIYDASYKEVLVSVMFSADDPGHPYGNWRFKAVKQLIYPKGFEGSLVTHIDAGSVWQNIGSMHVKNVVQDEGVLTIKKGLRLIGDNGTEASFGPLMDANEQLANCNMLYVLDDDSEEVNSWLSERKKRLLEQQTIMTFESKSLKREQDTHKDIVFVDVVDVYSNVPSKLLKFYKWVSGSMRFKYVMKVDDDTFVNPYRLLEVLDDPELNRTQSWWGSFRSHWAVNKYGKWADIEYNSLTYPTFACGSGSILSSDLINWIARNARYLHCYQGEDISVGIWLAAVFPHYIHNTQFICDDTCDREMILSAQNTIANIHIMWNNLLKCVNPCGCIADGLAL